MNIEKRILFYIFELLWLLKMKIVYVCRAINYGFMGTIVGHEITHSFDTQGKFYIFLCEVEDYTQY